MQKLLSKLRKAVNDFELISDGDYISVGLSGGKDSTMLVNLLKKYQLFSPEKFNLIAITLDPGNGADYTPLAKMCENINVEHKIIKTDINEIVFDIRKEKNPCSLCAKLRRGILNDMSKKLGCNKVALGHHKNDAIETLLLSLFYEGRINCFQPKTYLDRKDITTIRPMIYIEEKEIINLCNSYNLPIVKNPCTANGYTKREDMKNLIKDLKISIPSVEDNILGALMNVEQLNIWNKVKKNSD